ncbi:MAG: response regulator transcription factor [Phycisphaerales bacterium]|nr:response regulator transcription factor [Phycisphaerales bacterium]
MLPTVILVVEDDASIRRGMIDALQVSGYEPREATNGQEAITAIDAGDINLVLLDVMMPEVDGFGVLEHLRNRWPDLPVIMVTARGGEQDRVRGLSGGADDYIVKPFGIRELLARVEAVMRRTATTPTGARTLVRGAVTVDLANRCVAGDEPVPLTDREISILELLARHPDRAVSRDELLQRLWGTAPQGIETRTVDIHVSRLRGKLGDGFIETVRGCGYRLDPAVERAES